MAKFSYIDLFSGIGGFRVALDSLGGQSRGFAEIDQSALETYRMNFQTRNEHNLGDVRLLNHLPSVDVLVGGIPCQAWSVAGKLKGFNDPRGQLWFDAIRLVQNNKPKVFIFENVKGLMDPRNFSNLTLLRQYFIEAGYNIHIKLLNSYDFGLPQTRMRVFMLGFRFDQSRFSRDFEFPNPVTSNFVLADYLDGIPRKTISKSKLSKEILFNGRIPSSRNPFQKSDELNDFFTFCDTRDGHSTIHSWDLVKLTNKQKRICQIILQNRRKKIYGKTDGNPLSFSVIAGLIKDYKIIKKDIDSLIDKQILRYRGDKIDLFNSKNSAGINGIYRVYLPSSPIFSTLTATGTKDFVATKYLEESKNPKIYCQEFIKKILKPNYLRQITPSEAGRIQGFPKNFKFHSNPRLAQKQIGNAVSPPVVYHLVKSILSTQIFGQYFANSHQSRIASLQTQQLPLVLK